MRALTLLWLGSNKVKVLERKIPAGKPSHFHLNPCRDAVSVLILQLSWSSNYLSVTSRIFLLLKTSPYASTSIFLMLPLGVFLYSPGSLEDSTSEQPCTPELPFESAPQASYQRPPQDTPGGGCDLHCANKQRYWFSSVNHPKQLWFSIYHYLPCPWIKMPYLRYMTQFWLPILK